MLKRIIKKTKHGINLDANAMNWVFLTVLNGRVARLMAALKVRAHYPLIHLNKTLKIIYIYSLKQQNEGSFRSAWRNQDIQEEFWRAITYT